MILETEQHWVCPNCTVTALTHGQSNRYHNCGGLKGLYSPMVLDGTRCRIFAVEREDYIGQQLVQYDADGRPITSVITERSDGSNDVMVNVPTAQGMVN